MPDSPDARIARLEQAMAGLNERQRATDRTLDELRPLRVGHAEVAHDVHDLRTDMAELREFIREHARKQEQAQREQRERENLLHSQSIDSRQWKIGLGVLIVLSLIGVIAQVVLAVTA